MPRGTSKAIQEIPRRKEILQAATDAFAENGYHGASMEEIARVVGVRKAALYYYFPSKQELLYAILNDFTKTMIEGMEQIYSSSQSPVEKLRQAFYYHTQAIASRPTQFTVLLNEAKYLRGRRKKQIIVKRDHYEGIVRKMLQDGVDNGDLRMVNTKFAALSFFGVTNWMHNWYRPGQLSPEELAALFWDLVLRGLAAGEQHEESQTA